MEKDLCELCKGKDYGQLYADDLTKIHDYLAEKGIKIAMWGDHLLESVTEKEHQTWKSSAGYQYKIPGALRPEQVIKLIPKDILVFNWFWDDINNDKQVSEFGFQQVYGNLRPDIEKWKERSEIKGLWVVHLHRGQQQLNLISGRIRSLISWDVQIFCGQNNIFLLTNLH